MCNSGGSLSKEQASFMAQRWTDKVRGRDYFRFQRLLSYAHKRWRMTRDMRHARYWVSFIEAVKTRAP